MSFDAGHIEGHLDLDTTSFKKGFEEAHTHAEEGGAHIREVLESIAEVASEIAGPAFAEMGQEIQSAFAGFSEGPVIGALNLIGFAAGQMREATLGTAEELHQIGIEAKKAGVDTEFMGRMAAAAKTVDVSLDQLGMGFHRLLDKVGEADEGNKEAIKTFEKLGITAEEANKLATDPEDLWTKVQDKLSKIPSVAERVAISQELMGKGSGNLALLLSMTTDEMNKQADSMEKLEGVADAKTVAMADQFHDLQIKASAAWEGLERKTAEPILEWFSAHHDEIEADILRMEDYLKNKLGAAFDFAKSHAAEFQAIGASLKDIFDAVLPVVEHLAKGIAGLTADLIEFAGEVAKDLHGSDVAGADGSKKHIYGDVEGGGGPITGVSNLLNQLTDGYIGVSPDETRRRQAVNAAGGESVPPTPPQNAPQTSNVTVHVNIKPDPKATAATVAQAILPIIQKAQDDHDQKTAGATASKMAGSAMGGQ